jgi:hypothetical protein
MREAGGRTVGGCARAFLGVVATLAALIVLPLVIGGVFLGLIHVGFLSGWEAEADLSKPTQLGITGPLGGPIKAVMPKCYTAQAQLIFLIGPDDTIIWQAAAPAPTPLTEFDLGFPPPGFADFQPLATQLDPATQYTLQVVPRVVEGVDQEADRSLLVALTGGATATFRPKDLVPDRMYVAGDITAQKDFDTSACG